MDIDPERLVSFFYLSKRNLEEARVVLPLSIRFGVSEHHPDVPPAWLLEAYDCTRQAQRTFLLANIRTPMCPARSSGGPTP